MPKIVTMPSAASVAKEITSTLPIVFATGYDPIEEGLVTSLSRPGGNITGVSFLGNMLGAKQVELLRELVPNATTIAVLLDTSTSFRGSASTLKDVETAGHSLGQHLNVLHAKDERDLDNASAILDRQRADALIVLGAAFFLSQRDRIIAMAELHGSDRPDFQGLTRSRSTFRSPPRRVAALADQVICENQRSAPGKAERRRRIASCRSRKRPQPHRSKRQLPKPSELQLFARRPG